MKRGKGAPWTGSTTRGARGAGRRRRTGVCRRLSSSGVVRKSELNATGKAKSDLREEEPTVVQRCRWWTTVKGFPVDLETAGSCRFVSGCPLSPKRQNATQPNSVQHCVQRCAATGGVGGRPRSASRISYDTRTARRVAVFPPAASRCPLASLSPQPSPPETSAYHRATRVPPPLSNVRATAPNAPLSHPLLCLAFARRAALPPFPRRGIATTSTPPTPPPRPQLTAFSRLARRRQASLPAHR